MHGFGPLELAVLALLALLLFGSRLPKMARSLGQGLQGFKSGLQDVKQQITAPANPDASPSQPTPPAADTPPDYPRKKTEFIGPTPLIYV